MNRQTTFLAGAVSACSISMAAAPPAHANAENNACLLSPHNTADPCRSEYWNITSQESPDLYVYCSSAPSTCSNATDFTQWRAQVFSTGVRLLNNTQVPGLPVQISSGDVGWCYAYAYDNAGGVNSDVTLYPGSCNVVIGQVVDEQVYIGVGKTPSLPQGAPQQLGRLQNAYTPNGTSYFIGIPNGPQGTTVPDNLNLVVWQKSQFDQLWVVPSTAGGGAIYDLYKDSNRSHVCLHAASYSQGAAITDAPCDTNPQSTDPLSVWQMIGSNKISGDPHPGCFILYSPYTGYAIGVAGGNGNVKNGGALVQWAYDGSANQFWCVK